MMSRHGIRIAALAAFIVFAVSTTGWAASPAETTAHRQEILDAMLTTDPPDTIADIRRVCALGQEPTKTAENRREGAYFTPDATDSCVTALVRTARDRRLAGLYAQLLTELGGSPDGAAMLAQTIGSTVLSGTTKVAIGNSKVAAVTPALAFDAGFAVAYQTRAASTDPVNLQQLKVVAEACLSQRQDPGTCFSVGHVYGARAASMR